jgi:hypothetical protein
LLEFCCKLLQICCCIFLPWIAYDYIKQKCLWINLVDSSQLLLLAFAPLRNLISKTIFLNCRAVAKLFAAFLFDYNPNKDLKLQKSSKDWIQIFYVMRNIFELRTFKNQFSSYSTQSTFSKDSKESNILLMGFDFWDLFFIFVVYLVSIRILNRAWKQHIFIDFRADKYPISKKTMKNLRKHKNKSIFIIFYELFLW